MRGCNPLWSLYYWLTRWWFSRRGTLHRRFKLGRRSIASLVEKYGDAHGPVAGKAALVNPRWPGEGGDE